MAAPVLNLIQHTATQYLVEKEKNLKIYHLTSYTNFRNSGAATTEAPYPQDTPNNTGIAGGGSHRQDQAVQTEKSLVQ